MASGARGLRALALTGGLLGVAGVALPVADTLQNHPGAAVFGLEPALVLGLWALPAGTALSCWRWCWPCAAAPGCGLATGGLRLLGLVPWA